MKLIVPADRVRYRTMSAAELRAHYLIEDLFNPGKLDCVYVDLDRAVIGSAIPLHDALTLPTYPELRAQYFTERRELGVLNIGGPGTVETDGTAFSLGTHDGLYIGQGSRSVVFRSGSVLQPAEFYLLSYPSHAQYPTMLVQSASVEPVRAGAPETANERNIIKLIHLEGVRSSQLVMGFTQLAQGSVWNTMPPHTHMRRTEIYFYFGLGQEDRVIHMMGDPQETRHLVVANKQVVLSPGWSIHCGVGTRNYSFCWGMGGENQVYTDMDAVSAAELQ